MKNYLVRENRQKYMKQKIKKMFNLTQEYIDANTEWEMMIELGFDRIWDSGKIKWVKEIKRNKDNTNNNKENKGTSNIIFQ